MLSLRRLGLLLFSGLLAFGEAAAILSSASSLAEKIIRSKNIQHILPGAVLIHGAMSAYEPIPDDPLERFLTELYCYKVAALGAIGVAVSWGQQPIHKAIGLSSCVGAVGTLASMVRGKNPGLSTPTAWLDLIAQIVAAYTLLSAEHLNEHYVAYGMINFHTGLCIGGIPFRKLFAELRGDAFDDGSWPAIQKASRSAIIGLVAWFLTIVCLFAGCDVDATIVVCCLGFFLAEVLNARFSVHTSINTDENETLVIEHGS